jgi:PAS domain S-box-containing protein
MFCAVVETTETVLAARRQAFRFEFEERIRDLATPDDVMAIAAEMLGQTFGVSRVGYCEVEADREHVVIDRDWTDEGAVSIAGRHRMNDFGPAIIAELKAGRVMSVDDVATDPRVGEGARAFTAIGTRSVLAVPLIKAGRFTAILFLHHARARRWTREEEALALEVAERTWGAVERARAEAARRATEARFRELNETLEEQVAARSAERDRLWNLSQDMLARADYDGMMSAVSPAWTAVLGWQESELLTRGYASFMHPEDMPPTLEAIQRMAATRRPARFQNRIATSDGGWKPIEWIVAPEPDGRNFIAVGRDLSERRQREAELAQAQEALRQSQKMEAMGSLTGGVAHDFNNLLTPIVGVLDMLQRRGIGGEREQRLLAGAAQSAERAKILVQRLLAFARRQPLQPVAVDVAELVAGMAALIASTTGPQIKVVVDARPDLPRAKADPNQLEMALLNLAVNARDAMPDGGTLRISVEPQTIGRPNRSGLRPGRYLHLSVADTGTGMDEETLARAIEPFFSTKGVGKGTGLGLSMVHGLASQLGGALAIRSTLGLGTNVELWLPQGDAEDAVPDFAAEASAPPVSSGTVLLVDDEELVRLSTADMLAELGYDVVEVSSAEEALRLLDQGLTPDILVTDHLMPGISGTELAHRLQANRPQLKILVVSGYAESEGIAPTLPRLTKPFRSAELAASLAALH